LNYGSSFLDKDIDEIIKKIINHFNEYELDIDTDVNSSYGCFICIAIFTKLYFDKMNQHFDSFGEKFGKGILELVKEKKPKFDEELYLDAFCNYLLHHQSTCHQLFFPKTNISGINNHKEVKLLLNGKYFRLLPEQSFSSFNIKFHFE